MFVNLSTFIIYCVVAFAQSACSRCVSNFLATGWCMVFTTVNTSKWIGTVLFRKTIQLTVETLHNVFLLCSSSIFTLVWSNNNKLKISLFISADSRSIKILVTFFVVLWITFITWLTVKPTLSMAILMSTVGANGWRFRIRIRKDFSSRDWYVWYHASLFFKKWIITR